MFTFKRKLAEVEEQLISTKKTNDELLTKNKELEDRITTLTAEPVNVDLFNEKVSLLEESKVTIENLSKTVESLTAQVIDLTKNNFEFDAAVSAKALEIAQSQGIPPLSCKPSSTPASTISNGDLVAQYEALTKEPMRQRKFWEENRESLMNIIKGIS